MDSCIFGHASLGQTKYMCFWPCLGFWPDPEHFIVKSEQNIVKFNEKWGKCGAVSKIAYKIFK